MAFCHSGVQYCCFFTAFKFQPLNCYLKNALEPYYLLFISLCLFLFATMHVFFQKMWPFTTGITYVRHPLVLPQDNHCLIYLLTVCALAFVFIFPQTSVILVLALCLPLQELSEFILLTSFHLHFSHSHFSLSFSLPEASCLGQLCIYSSVCSFVPFICISLPHTQTRTHWCSAVRSGD